MHCVQLCSNWANLFILRRYYGLEPVHLLVGALPGGLPGVIVPHQGTQAEQLLFLGHQLSTKRVLCDARQLTQNLMHVRTYMYMCTLYVHVPYASKNPAPNSRVLLSSFTAYTYIGPYMYCVVCSRMHELLF